MIRLFAEESLVPGSSHISLDGASAPAGTLLARPQPAARHLVTMPIPSSERATVSLVRTTDEDIDDAGIERMVRIALARIGGRGRFLQPRPAVLVKPHH